MQNIINEIPSTSPDATPTATVSADGTTVTITIPVPTGTPTQTPTICPPTPTNTPTPTPISTPEISEYNVEFTENWPSAQKSAAVSAIIAVGEKLASISGGSAAQAFRNAYQGKQGLPTMFLWGAGGYTGGYNIGECQGDDVGGCTVGQSGSVYLIVFFSFLSTDSQWRMNNVVHELGHLFNDLHGGYPMSFAGNYAAQRKELLRPQEGTTVWQMHAIYDPNTPSITNPEMFADMYVAWTYDAWNRDPLNEDLVKNATTQMDAKMSEWVL